MQRHLICMIGLALLAVAAGLHLSKAAGASTEAAFAACLRVGLVASAFWLAWPGLRRVPLWLAQAMFVGALIVAFNRRAAVLVIPILLVMWFIRPRPKR